MFARAASPATTLDKLWGFAKSYASNVFHSYLDFVAPLILVMVLSQVLVRDDKERFGLGWMYATSLKDDKVREEKFPAYEPSSSLERRRLEAASRVEYIAANV